jgi:hypothetical protein
MPWSHRHGAPVGCTETPFTGSDLDEPPLKVPEGLNAPDTRNAIKVPPLNTPDTPRPKSDPCLDQPPSFATAPAVPKGTAPPPAAASPATPATPAAPSTATPETVPAVPASTPPHP